MKHMTDKNNGGVTLVAEKCFLGLPLYRRWEDDRKGTVRTSYLGGLVDTYRKGESSFCVYFMRIQLWSRRDLSCRLLFFPRWSYTQKWLKWLDSQIPSEYDDVYLFRHNFGETIIELMHFKQRVAAKGSERPLALARNAVYKDLIDMFLPEGVESRCIPMAQGEIMRAFGEKQPLRDKDVVHKLRLHRLICSLPRIGEWMNDCSNHFYSFISVSLGVPLGAPYATPRLSLAAQEAARQRMESLRLEERRFILLSPEATSMCTLHESFWQDMIDSLRAHGYEVLLNALPGSFSFAGATRIFPLLSELYAIAQAARGIICMGSGVAALFVFAGVEMDVLYTDSRTFDARKKRGLNAEQILLTYSFAKLPNYHPLIREYIASPHNLQDLKQQILSHYL